MSEEITLAGGVPGEFVTVKIDDSMRWPVRIKGADRHYISLTDEEAAHLMRLLLKRYPLDALADGDG